MLYFRAELWSFTATVHEISVSIFILLVMLRVLGHNLHWSFYMHLFRFLLLKKSAGQEVMFLHEGRNYSGLTSEISPLTKCNYNLPLPFSGMKYNP